MRKKVFGKQLGRGRGARRALFASLLRALILNGKIVTTHAKAKAFLPEAEKVVSLAKDGNLSARRRILAILMNQRDVVSTLFAKVIPILALTKGRFTKVTLLPRRKGDAAEMALVKWSERAEKSDKKEDKKESKK